ncbi:MAG TPA: hypothetical protein VFZ78_07365 [Flavisolibacter sp.]
MMRWLILLFICFFSSCMLFSGYRKSSFTYSENGTAHTVPVLVPRGYTGSSIERDSAGNTWRMFRYPGRGFFYVGYWIDSLTGLQDVQPQLHQQKEHPSGGWEFKSMDNDHLFWRELRKGGLRTGYRYISPAAEPAFDSASNYTIWKVGN